MTGRAATALTGIDVAVLAGGLGTRLKSVLADRPKLLAPIQGRPFLDHLLDWLEGFGAERIVLCLGHLADQVGAHLEATYDRPMDIDLVIEPKPLGTGGALRFAMPHLTSDPVLAMNGDTWIDVDLAAFVAAHRRTKAEVSLLCAGVDDISRFARVELAPDGSVARYAEKDPGAKGPGLISGGIYLFSRKALDELSAVHGPSLERDFLQKLAPGRVKGFVAKGAFVDIGTPESLAAAGGIIKGGDPES